MKTSLIILLSVLLLSFALPENKKITGHWINEHDLYDMQLNDTLVFTKVKYNDHLYQWGGAVCGMELSADHRFSEFHNVLCSSESNPLRYAGEKWSLSNDTLSINSEERMLQWKVISLSNKKLTVIVTKINMKNE
jgi:hypothetical protein